MCKDKSNDEKYCSVLVRKAMPVLDLVSCYYPPRTETRSRTGKVTRFSGLVSKDTIYFDKPTLHTEKLWPTVQENII